MKCSFFPSSGCVDTTTWMLTKHNGEKAWQQLYKNVASNNEQDLEAAPHKAAAVQPPTIHHENYPS